MNRKPLYFTVVILFWIISVSAYASDPPPSGLMVTVVPDFDIYGNGQKKIQISWDPYHSRMTCCDNDIDRLLEYSLIITLKRSCYSAGSHIISLPKNQTSFSIMEPADTNIVQVSLSARVLSPVCYGCGSAASYGTDSTTQVVNMATEGCTAYLSIPPEDTDICSSKRKEIGEPISVLNGEMTLEETDFKIEGINLDFEFKRNYSSRQQISSASAGIIIPVNKSNGSILFSELMEVGRNGGSSPIFSKSYNSLTTGAPIGWGWSHNFNAHLDFLQSGDVIRFVNEKGRSVYFYRQSSGSSYYSPAGKPTAHSLLDNGDSTYSLNDGKGYLKLFGNEGELLSIISEEGNHIELEYDDNRKLIRIYDTLGRHYTLNYDSDGRILSVAEDSQGMTLVSYIYDSDGLLISALYPDNSSSSYEYSDEYDNQNITKTTARNGRTHTYIYDALDRIASFSDDNEEHFSSLEYYPNDLYTKLTNTKGVSTFFHYESINRAGIFKSTTGYSCATCASPFYSYTNDGFGRTTEERDSYGNITSFENFDNSGRPQLISYGKGSSYETAVYYLYHQDIDTPLSVKTESVLGNGFREIEV